MHAEQARRGCTACMACALPVILDDLGSGTAEPGYHALVCATWHARAACITCKALKRYAAERAVLSATRTDGHVALLRKGAPKLALWDLVGGNLDSVSIRTAAGEHPPTVSEPTWASAANLVDGHTTLARALQAAAALYADPAK